VAGRTINPLSTVNSAGPLDPTALLAAAALADRIVPARATRGAATAPARRKRLTQTCILIETTTKIAKARELHAPSASQRLAFRALFHPPTCLSAASFTMAFMNQPFVHKLGGTAGYSLTCLEQLYWASLIPATQQPQLTILGNAK